MPGRRQRDRQRCRLRLLPPVTLLNTSNAGRPHETAVFERCHYQRIEPPCQPAKRRQIAMIVVVVAEEDDRDVRQVVEPNRRLTDSVWTDAVQRTGAV